MAVVELILVVSLAIAQIGVNEYRSSEIFGQSLALPKGEVQKFSCQTGFVTSISAVVTDTIGSIQFSCSDSTPVSPCFGPEGFCPVANFATGVSGLNIPVQKVIQSTSGLSNLTFTVGRTQASGNNIIVTQLHTYVEGVDQRIAPDNDAKGGEDLVFPTAEDVESVQGSDIVVTGFLIQTQNENGLSFVKSLVPYFKKRSVIEQALLPLPEVTLIHKSERNLQQSHGVPHRDVTELIPERQVVFGRFTARNRHGIQCSGSKFVTKICGHAIHKCLREDCADILTSLSITCDVLYNPDKYSQSGEQLHVGAVLLGGFPTSCIESQSGFTGLKSTTFKYLPTSQLDGFLTGLFQLDDKTIQGGSVNDQNTFQASSEDGKLLTGIAVRNELDGFLALALRFYEGPQEIYTPNCKEDIDCLDFNYKCLNHTCVDKKPPPVNVVDKSIIQRVYPIAQMANYAYETIEQMPQVEGYKFVIGSDEVKLPSFFDRIVSFQLYQGSDHHVIAFRGSKNLENWIFQNIQTKAIDCSTSIENCPGQVHSGFLLGYAEIREKLLGVLTTYNVSNVVITGHSLGGALATLCAYEFLLNKKFNVAGFYTFGSPKTVDPVLAQDMEAKLKGISSRRFVTVNRLFRDVVALLPISRKYVHILEPTFLTSKFSTADYLTPDLSYVYQTHSMSTYERSIQSDWTTGSSPEASNVTSIEGEEYQCQTCNHLRKRGLFSQSTKCCFVPRTSSLNSHLSLSTSVIESAKKETVISQQRNILWDYYVFGNRTLKVNFEEVIVQFPVNFDGMMMASIDVDKSSRQVMLAGFDKQGLIRCGSPPTDYDKGGRGVFSDEDMQCKEDKPEQSAQCETTIANFLQSLKAPMKNWSSGPMFETSDEWDIIIWKNDVPPDFCSDSIAWMKWLNDLVAEKEKSYIGWAQYMGVELNFSHLEIILEMMSKSRYYLKATGSQWVDERFNGWDHFAQFAKAMDRMQKNLQKREFGREIQTFNGWYDNPQNSEKINFNYTSLSKMFVGPCELNMCNEFGVVDTLKMASQFDKFIKFALNEFKESIVVASDEYESLVEKANTEGLPIIEAQELLRTSLRIDAFRTLELDPLVGNKKLLEDLYKSAANVLKKRADGVYVLQYASCKLPKR